MNIRTNTNRFSPRITKFWFHPQIIEAKEATREWNSFRKTHTFQNRARVFRTCAMRLSRKTEQSYATERNPRNDFPSYMSHVPSFGIRAFSTCKNPSGIKPRLGRRSIEGEGGISLLCDRVDTWPRVGIHHPPPPPSPSVLRRHDDGGTVNILWIDGASVGCSWMDRYARGWIV